MSDKRWAVLLLLLGGVAVAAHTISHGHVVPPHRPLVEFPRTFGEFTAVTDVPISAGVLAILGDGDFMQRIYRGPSSRAAFNLYIGYYPRQEKGDTIHSPQHCLPGGGWEPLDISVKRIPLADGRTIAVNRYLLQNGH